MFDPKSETVRRNQMLMLSAAYFQGDAPSSTEMKN